MRSLKIKWRLLLAVPFLLLSTGVLAGVGIGVAPTYPVVVSVGDTGVAVSLRLTNTSTSPQDVGDTRIDTIQHHMSCGDFTVPCTDADPGVFSVSATGTGADDCTGINFAIAQTDVVNGELTFTPDANVDLAVAEFCTINFTVDVVTVPSKDAQGVAGLQTVQGARVAATHISSQVPGTGSGTSLLTVFDCTVSITKCVIVDTDGDGLLTDETCVDSATSLNGAVAQWQIVVTDDGPGSLGGCVVNDPTLNIVNEPVDLSQGPVQINTNGICVDTVNTATVTCNTCDGFSDTNSDNDGATLDCEDCSVEVDKQVSCDGGSTWVDQGFQINNGDGTNTCSGLTTDQIMVRYQARNPESACALTGCTWTESNNAFGQPNDPFDLGNGASTGLTTPSSEQCDTAFGDPGNPNEPNTIDITCNAEFGDPVSASDTASFSCLNVDLLVDRNVACDGGSATDMTLVRANNDGTNGCTTLVGNNVNWEYQYCNNGTAPLFDCTLVDSNVNVSASIVVGNLAADDCSNVGGASATLDPLLCSTQLQSDEAANGKVTLTCCTQDVANIASCDQGDRVSVFDESDVTCQTQSSLNIVKTCVDSNQDGTDDAVTVQVSATAADLGFTACTPTDTIYLDDPTCPPSGSGTDVPLGTPSGPYDLAPGASETSEGTLPVLTADACNTASVSCLDASGAVVVEDAADVICDFTGEGCITRTPGFWGNRPDTADDYIPVEVCGTPLNSVLHNEVSTTEAICSVGKDHKILGNHLTQLIRQCTAAALNHAVSADEGGGCPQADEANFADCCSASAESNICSGEDTGNSVTECIALLDEFNNRLDTLQSDVFVGLGRAQSYECRKSRNNGFHPLD